MSKFSDYDVKKSSEIIPSKKSIAEVSRGSSNKLASEKVLKTIKEASGDNEVVYFDQS